MSLLKKIGLLLAALLILGGAYVGNIIWRLDLAFNDIVQEIQSDPNAKKWGERVPLIPGQFALGSGRGTVLKMLNRDGFQRLPDEKVWTQYQYEIDQGREIYTREANNGICNIVVYVFVEFDAGDKVTFAEGAQHETGCL